MHSNKSKPYLYGRHSSSNWLKLGSYHEHNWMKYKNTVKMLKNYNPFGKENIISHFSYFKLFL